MAKKWDAKKCPTKDDYKIFFGISEKGGKDNSGNYVFKKDSNKVVVDNHGHPVIDHDLDEVAEEFIKFAKKEKLSFW